MEDYGYWFAVGFIALFIIVLFMTGGIIGTDMVHKKCHAGHPIVIENKVYRCVESK